MRYEVLLCDFCKLKFIIYCCFCRSNLATFSIYSNRVGTNLYVPWSQVRNSTWNLNDTLFPPDSFFANLVNGFLFSGPILSMDMSPTGDMCYTGGFDGVVCCWSVPSVNTDIYEPYGMILFCLKFTEAWSMQVVF